jgi:hypothetical protein
MITCTISLGSSSPPTWRIAAEFSFRAGAQMDDIASSVEQALA